MTIGLAMLPILVIFTLLFLLRKSAVKAGLSAYLITILITAFVPQFKLDFYETLNSTIKGILISSVVAYVLLFGILLFHLMNKTGLIKSFASFISNSTSDPVRQVILLVVAFSPLVESVSGFGIAIIVVAPILIELGFDRFRATLLSLVGLSAVPWGALATGTVIGANLAGIPLPKLGAGSAVMAIPTFLYFGLVAVYLAGGWRGVKQKWLELLVVSGALSVSIWLFSKYISVELAGALGAMVAISLELLFIRIAAGRPIQESKVGLAKVSDTSNDAAHKIIKAISPYLFLTGTLLASRLIPPLESFFSSTWVLELPNYSFRLPLLYSPGFFIFLTSLFTIYFFKIPKRVIKESVQATLKQWSPVIMSTMAFVAMSEIMSAAGMTGVLANATVALFGPAFMYLSPVIGGVGGFLTGSNTGSNAMFIKLQVQAAHQLGIDPEILAVAQNTSASHMTMASPSRVLLGVSVGGIQAEENLLLRKIFLIALGALAILILEMARF